MRLLFDQNLSPKLVGRLSDLFPGSSHVQIEGLDCAGDDRVWEHALNFGFAIVTKDSDYDSLSVIRGTPPKVIWLLIGNCTTDEIEALFRGRFPEIDAFDRDPAVGVMTLG